MPVIFNDYKEKKKSFSHVWVQSYLLLYGRNDTHMSSFLNVISLHLIYLVSNEIKMNENTWKESPSSYVDIQR